MFEEIVKLAKSIQHARVTADGVVCNSPAILFHGSLVSDQAGEADAILYDGNSTAGKLMFDMAAVDDGADRMSFWPGVYFAKGIYIDVVTNVESVTVVYLPIKE